MTSLDVELIRRAANRSPEDGLVHIEALAEIDSTNSYLMQMPGPEPRKSHIAVTNNQTAGRGRHGKTWQSPAGSGLCLSAAYTFTDRPDDLSALTLALGLGAIDALEELGARDVKLKWPNDLVALDGKLGGILTEVQPKSPGAVSVVAGIGINVDLNTELDFGIESDWARRVVDLKNVCAAVPSHEEVAGKITKHLLKTFVDFETSGFAAVSDRWSQYDWLLGREITIDTAAGQFSGIGAGVAEDGALLVDTAVAGIRRVTSGTIVIAASRDERQ
jgi:BirA family biotin operon repressor/biotin-[acetyl-CoA-carboxylase] ligase